MQSRRSIYYQGNSVAAPRPSKANIARRRAREAAGLNEPKIVDDQPKVCATEQCVWCEVAFEQYQVRCHVCGLCQYCGAICPSTYGCTTCANILPEELKQVSSGDYKKRRIRVTK